MSLRVTCLFWNLNRRERDKLLVRLATEIEADIVVLAETGGEPERTLRALQDEADSRFRQPASQTQKIQIFACLPDLQEVYGDVSGRVTIRAMNVAGAEVLLAAAHLHSKLFWQPSEQAVEAVKLADQIRRVEEDRGHRRTVLVGDLNMNPFEEGIVNAAGLHAMMSREIVAPGSRVVQERDYPFFYNPMWGFFGDRTPGPPGTLHHRHSGHLSYDWNIFDQVLIRPDILSWFQDEVEIVTRIGETDLAGAKGRPDQEIGSDHFPICFRLMPV